MMNLLELQKKAREQKWTKETIGTNNILGINNRLVGRKVEDIVVEPIAIVQEYNFEAYKTELQEVIEQPARVMTNTISEELVIPYFLLPEYKLMKLAAKAYKVDIEAIEMAIKDGELEIFNTKEGYKAVLYR